MARAKHKKQYDKAEKLRMFREASFRELSRFAGDLKGFNKYLKDKWLKETSATE